MAFELAYETWGEGPRPLLLLHGFTGNRHGFAHLRPLLGHAVRAVAVDLPGHGESPLPPHTGREGFLDTVDALVRVLDREGLRRAHVLGYSQGARLALALAVRAPERVERLVLESGSPGLRRRQERVARRASDAELAAFLRANGVEAFVRRWEALPLFAGLGRIPRELREALSARRRGQTAEGLAGALECLGTGAQPEYWRHLFRLHVPTLLVTGREDVKFTDIARRMAAELPSVWSCSLAGVGHAPHLEAPEAYAHEVLSFLETPWYEAPQFDSPADAASAAAASRA